MSYLLIATKAFPPGAAKPFKAGGGRKRKRDLDEDELAALAAVEDDEDDTGEPDPDLSDDEPDEPDEDEPDEPPTPTDDTHEWAGDEYIEGDETDPAVSFAAFTGTEGEEAWLDRADDGTLTGWVLDADGTVFRYSDVDAWAVDVDDAGMTRGDTPDDELDAEDAEDEDPDTDLAADEEPDLFAGLTGKSLVLATKHAPGDHNQDSHGNRSGRSAARVLIRGTPRPRAPSRTAPRARSARTRRPSAGTTPGGGDGERRRRARRRTSLPQTGPGARLRDIDTLDMRSLSDADLASLYRQAMDEGEGAGGEMNRILAEMDRRDNVADRLRGRGEPGSAGDVIAEGKAMDDAAGFDDPFQRDTTPRFRSTMTKAQRARAEYDEWAYTQYLRAEAETRGNVLSKAGQERGVNPQDLLTGSYTPAQVRKYASEELLRWFAASPLNERKTWTEFSADALGWRSAKRAKARGRGGRLSQF